MKTPLPLWFPLLFPVYFVFVWTMVCWIISLIGWKRFTPFRTPAQVRGQAFKFQSLSINGVNYNNCLSCVVALEGFEMRMLPIFPFHPPLLIPWSAFQEMSERRVLFMNVLDCWIQIPGGGRAKLSFPRPPLREAVQRAAEDYRANAPTSPSGPFTSPSAFS